MALAHSKVTSQGQTSVPTAVRQKLGIGPGSVLEWAEEGDQVVVRRAHRVTSMDIHRQLFPDGPPKRKSLKQLKEGIRDHIGERHARGRY